MKTEEAIKYFQGKRRLADALGISVQAVQAWKENVPALREYQIKELMRGKKSPVKKLDI